jgi:hypothetical protein
LVSGEYPHPPGAEPGAEKGIPSPSGRELLATGIRHTAGDEFARGFSPLLSWSHYRALMRVDDRGARDFYEREAALEEREKGDE